MSTSINIKEGGIPRGFGPVKKLRIIESGDTHGLWVPKSSVQTGRLSVTKNGEHVAADDGLYGYDEVDVEVTSADKITGKDANGNPTVVGVDDNGDLWSVELPEYIDIISDPTKLIYNYDETIDLEGIVVRAYKHDGQVWTGNGQYPDGIIPLAELTCDPTTANGDNDDITAYSEEFGSGPWPQPVHATVGFLSWEGGYGDSVLTYVGYIAILVDNSGFVANYINDILFASAEPGEGTYQTQVGTPYPHTSTIYVNTAYTYDGKTVYYNGIAPSGTSYTGSLAKNENVEGHNLERAQAAWTLLYGLILDGQQVITVQWARPGDGEILTDTYTVTVTGQRE